MKNCIELDELIAELEKDPLIGAALNTARERLAKMKAEMTPEDFSDYVCGHFIDVRLLPSNTKLNGA
jgi:hypothetical protein